MSQPALPPQAVLMQMMYGPFVAKAVAIRRRFTASCVRSPRGATAHDRNEASEKVAARNGIATRDVLDPLRPSARPGWFGGFAQRSNALSVQEFEALRKAFEMAVRVDTGLYVRPPAGGGAL